MKGDKIRKFMQLAGQPIGESFHQGTASQRKLGAQLLLSEVLEYVIHGLGVIPCVDGTPISEPDKLSYQLGGQDADKTEMLDGLADVAYTMYWNALAFGQPLEQAFEMVCDNNLEKFVRLESWETGAGEIDPNEWHCNQQVSWPDNVVVVEAIQIGDEFFAVGKDAAGKVRKPSHYQSVDLARLVA